MAHPEWRTPERVLAAARLREIVAPAGPRPYVRFSGLQIDGVSGGTATTSGIRCDPIGRLWRPTTWRRGLRALAKKKSTPSQRHLNSVSGTAQKQPTTRATSRAPIPKIRTWRRVFELGARSRTPGKFRDRKRSIRILEHRRQQCGRVFLRQPTAANGGEPAWRGKHASSAVDFAARALEYVRAVQPCSPAPGFGTLSRETWTPGAARAALSACSLCSSSLRSTPRRSFLQSRRCDDAGPARRQYAGVILGGSELFRARFEDLARVTALRAPNRSRLRSRISLGDAFRAASFCSRYGSGSGWLADSSCFCAARREHACQHLSLGFGDQDLLIEPCTIHF